jgi:hypothetical protein
MCWLAECQRDGGRQIRHPSLSASASASAAACCSRVLPVVSHLQLGHDGWMSGGGVEWSRADAFGLWRLSSCLLRLRFSFLCLLDQRDRRPSRASRPKAAREEREEAEKRRARRTTAVAAARPSSVHSHPSALMPLLRVCVGAACLSLCARPLRLKVEIEREVSLCRPVRTRVDRLEQQSVRVYGKGEHKLHAEERRNQRGHHDAPSV